MTWTIRKSLTTASEGQQSTQRSVGPKPKERLTSCFVWPKSIAWDSLTLALKTEAYGCRRHPETVYACMEMAQRPRTGKNDGNARRRSSADYDGLSSRKNSHQ